MVVNRDDSNAIVNQPVERFVLIGGHRDLQFSTVVDKAWTTLIFVLSEQLLVERPTDVMQNNTRFWRIQNGRHTLMLLALHRGLMPHRSVLHDRLRRTLEIRAMQFTAQRVVPPIAKGGRRDCKLLPTPLDIENSMALLMSTRYWVWSRFPAIPAIIELQYTRSNCAECP
jgi:hypothetical protein